MAKATQEMKADAVIIGSGAAGLSAALTTARGGATVILFEKTAEFGGMTNYALGMFAVESRHQKREKCGLTVEQAFQRHMRNCHWLADARLVRTFMDKSAETIDWLEELGVEFGPIDSYAPDGPRVWHPVKGFAGSGLVQPLLKKVRAEKNVQIFMETAGKKLLTEGGSRGIGKATALGFAQAGADVVVVSRKQADLEQVVEEIRALGRRSLPIPAHLGKVENIKVVVLKAKEAFERIVNRSRNR